MSQRIKVLSDSSKELSIGEVPRWPGAVHRVRCGLMAIPQPKIKGRNLTSLVLLYEEAFAMVMASNLRSRLAGRLSRIPESNARNVCLRSCPQGHFSEFQPGRVLAAGSPV